MRAYVNAGERRIGAEAEPRDFGAARARRDRSPISASSKAGARATAPALTKRRRIELAKLARKSGEPLSRRLIGIFSSVAQHSVARSSNSRLADGRKGDVTGALGASHVERAAPISMQGAPHGRRTEGSRREWPMRQRAVYYRDYDLCCFVAGRFHALRSPISWRRRRVLHYGRT